LRRLFAGPLLLKNRPICYIPKVEIRENVKGRIPNTFLARKGVEVAEPFNPYHTWLGIPPEEQPPTYYRLLGIRLFEADAQVIEHAADQRMAYLRMMQTGAYSHWSQRLLNEVASARICLLDPNKKGQELGTGTYFWRRKSCLSHLFPGFDF